MLAVMFGHVIRASTHHTWVGSQWHLLITMFAFGHSRVAIQGNATAAQLVSREVVVRTDHQRQTIRCT
jgi:hypothetical protein